MKQLPCTAFIAGRLVANGDLEDVAVSLRQTLARDPDAIVLVFDDTTGKQVDLDLRGSDEDVVRRLADHPLVGNVEPDVKRGPGRPKLGVVAREITLLPRHWEWLTAQPGGASVTLRKMIDDARQTTSGRDRSRQAREAAYNFLSSMAGNEAGYEEALRALFAKDCERFTELMSSWPTDVAAHASKLAAPAFA